MCSKEEVRPQSCDGILNLNFKLRLLESLLASLIIEERKRGEEMEDVLKRGGPASVVWRDDWEMAVLLF